MPHKICVKCTVPCTPLKERKSNASQGSECYDVPRGSLRLGSTIVRASVDRATDTRGRRGGVRLPPGMRHNKPHFFSTMSCQHAVLNGRTRHALPSQEFALHTHNYHDQKFFPALRQRLPARHPNAAVARCLVAVSAVCGPRRWTTPSQRPDSVPAARYRGVLLRCRRHGESRPSDMCDCHSGSPTSSWTFFLHTRRKSIGLIQAEGLLMRKMSMNRFQNRESFDTPQQRARCCRYAIHGPGRCCGWRFVSAP